ncbi:hypothetical protein SETIT_1G007300v2 [Setaria italica]|uniref:Uncharacterized protein n=2 Tax=Setaria italica TaxID=4555 RepID=A0A368PFD5_SETIT|nr:transcription factor MYB3R-4-like isoform X1 [Setaria italica]RCV04511.1 hypothetical protein SETIT_1G007300v2 [Setaria italica]RCV04512.1 hypothetical protein SETIT_1G007300v2 [Setaria italica]RCV04513.1 hypothetical protein SETIT_1G007300v2 [Setaria italica]
MVRSAGGVHRRGTSTKPTSCSREIDWIAEEHDEPLQASEYFDDEEPEGTVSFKRRGAWSQEENEILIQMVDTHSSKDWSSIARAVPGRSRKQCRDRWTHYLDPAVNQMPWSEQEEIDLIRAHKIHGNKWCELAKFFPGRTGKAIKNYWTGAMKKKIKSNLGSGSPEQLSPCPNDSLIPVGRDSTATSSQDSSNNIPISSADLPVRLKSKHGLTEACRNACTLKEKGPDSIHDEGSIPHSVNVSQMVDGRTVGSSLRILTEEKLVSPLSSVDEKVSCVAANSPKPLKEEESTNFLEIPPALSFQSSNVHSDAICSSADPESRQLHLASIADLLDMSYCESLMVIAPDSTNDEDFKLGM